MGLSDAEVKKLTVKQLQDELAKHGLDKKGVKADLQARLLKHLQTAASDAAEASSTDSAIAETSIDKPESDQDDNNNDQPSNESVDALPTEEAPTSEEATAQRAPSPRQGDDQVPAATPKTAESASTHSSSPQESPDVPVDGGKRQLDSPSAATASKKQKTAELDAIPESTVSPTATIRIDNFIRPFTLNAVKAFVQLDASFVENGFWMDAIKTHCYVTYATTDAAIEARSRIYGTTWPELSGRQLTVEFSTATAADIAAKHAATGTLAPPTARRGSVGVAQDPPKPTKKAAKDPHAKPPVGAADLFCKTKAEPVLFYLPVDDDLVARRRANLEKKKLGLLPQRRRSGRNRRGGRHHRGNRGANGPPAKA